ncbi:MAG TPA: SRPBCC family protein [Acidimicrobiales bacterium]|nr:SRPBCC family protein [Acidimicrobiales bacterium]
MSETATEIAAPVEVVFAVVADPTTYPEWLVGAKEIHMVEEHWPEPGARFFHTVGAGPVTVDDSTSVLEVEAPTKLVLEARAGAVATARVTFRLDRLGEAATSVSMEEDAVEGAASHLPSALIDPPLGARNQQSLQRLKDRIEAGAGGR